MKKNKMPIILGVFIIAIAAVMAFLFLRPEEDLEETIETVDVSQSEEVQNVLFELGSGEVNGLFFSMFSLDAYDESDFLTYLGLNTVMLREQMETGEEVIQFLELALAENHALESVYIGLSMDAEWGVPKGTYGGMTQMFTDACAWDWELLPFIEANPNIKFHFIFEYPSIYEMAELSALQRTRLYKWQYEIMEQFALEEAYENVKFFLPETEEWLVANQANYLENGMPNAAASRFVLGQMICMDSYLLKPADFYNRIGQTEALIEESVMYHQTENDYTYVFFGDSVIGNFTDSMSIPGVVQGLSGVNTINCGYGGLSAAVGEDGFGFPSVIEAFLEGRYEHFPEDKPIRTGISDFYQKLPEMNQEKLIFFISIGLNDYMSAKTLKSETTKDITTYIGSLEYVIEKLQKAYPQSEIVLMTPNFLARENFGTNKLNGYTMDELANEVLSLSTDLGLKCIDVFHGVPINETNYKAYIPDQCHPSEFGRYEIGKLIYQYLLYWNEIGSE